jgi:hypothetical protein
MNDYSLAVHHYISGKIAAVRESQKDAEHKNDAAAASYFEGQLRELTGIRQYMADKIDLKTQKYF